MLSANTALTGKRVYRNSSYAPTRGTNNPKGYVQRELRNQNRVQKAQKIQPQKPAAPIQKQTPGKHGISKVGNDGQSDTRSGLAARAMMPPGSPQPRPAGPGGFGKPRIGTALSMTKTRPVARPKPKPGFLQHAPLTTPQYKPIAINNNGRLDLPFEYSAAQNALEHQQAANQNLQDLQAQSQQHAAEYLKSMRDTQGGYQDQQRQSLNDSSGRGTAFTSQYGTAVANNATNYNNQVNDLNSQNTLFNNDIASKQNGVTADLNDYLRQQALARGVQLAGQFGTLGYGTSKAKPAIRPKKAKAKKR